MGSITDYMFDTSHLESVLKYLKNAHSIHVVVLDSDKQVVPLAACDRPPVFSASVFYPFHCSENIGGLFCSADKQATIDNAAPHIAICLAGINAILEREQEITEAGGEILQLSAQLNFLFQLAHKIIGINNLTEFSSIILEEISKAVKADCAFIQTKGRWDDEINISWNISNHEVESLTKSSSYQTASLAETIIFTLEGGDSLLSSPIREKDGIIGNMTFLRKKNHPFFTAYEKKFLSIISNIISPSIETLRLYDSLQDLYVNTVKALAMAIDAKDEYTHGHSYRVAKYSVAIGRKLNIPEKSLNDLEIAAYMHDLGKIGISESILGKPDKLTDEEYDLVKKHPEMTDKILKPIHLPEFIVDAAVQHHERLDGRGYPFGLIGDDICAFARIIAVADVFDAMTSKRPYREAMPVEKAMTILCKGADKEFDQNMVLGLIESMQDKEETRELSDIYRDLTFSDFQGLNNFLSEMASSFTPLSQEDISYGLPDHCAPLFDKARK